MCTFDRRNTNKVCVENDSLPHITRQSYERCTYVYYFYVDVHRTIEGRCPAEAKDFSSGLCVHSSCEAHTASCTTGTGGKARPGRDADHSPTSSAEVMNE